VEDLLECLSHYSGSLLKQTDTKISHQKTKDLLSLNIMVVNTGNLLQNLEY